MKAISVPSLVKYPAGIKIALEDALLITSYVLAVEQVLHKCRFYGFSVSVSGHLLFLAMQITSSWNACVMTTRTDWKNWQGEIKATLMFIKRDDEVLLIEKLTGIGMGKINGPGGKIDPGETPHQAIIRECQEELHITPLDPIKVGELCFAMTHIPDIHCHVFIATEFEGTPTPTREANPFWEKISEIPYEKMWEDDRHWLPQALNGEIFHASFDFIEEKIIWQNVQFGESAKSLWLCHNV